MMAKVTWFRVECRDCEKLWVDTSYTWETASSSARRHSKLLGHRLSVEQARSWWIEPPSDKGREAETEET